MHAMTDILWLDTETKSECDLPLRGAYNYAQHITTKLLCLTYAFNDEDVGIWWANSGEPFPSRITAHIRADGQIRCHNAAFDRLIFLFVIWISKGLCRR